MRIDFLILGAVFVKEKSKEIDSHCFRFLGVGEKNTLDAPAGCFSARNALRGTMRASARPESGLPARLCCSACLLFWTFVLFSSQTNYTTS